MDSLTQREESFERAFAHDEEVRFKARARRNRMLGEWAGGKLGLSGPALQDYARALAASGLEHPDDERLVAQLVKALQKHNISEHRVRRQLAEFDAAATADIHAGR